MQKYTKQNKIYTTPVLIKKDGKNIYTNDETLILAEGYTIYQAPKKSVETLVKESVLRINAETDNKILNGFKYGQDEYYLTMQNQQNFANMFIAKDYLEYPITVKTKTGYAQLADVEQVTMFYLSGVNYIKQCLAECWQKKIKKEEQIRTNNV